MRNMRGEEDDMEFHGFSGGFSQRAKYAVINKIARKGNQSHKKMSHKQRPSRKQFQDYQD